jgi:DNA-binding transcriptional regulator YhcF (GntR family)
MALRVDAEKQNIVLGVLLTRRVLSLRQLTNLCPLAYHQVASCLIALVSKGYVRRVRTGIYEVTEEARLITLNPEEQIKALQRKVVVLEAQIKKLMYL